MGYISVCIRAIAWKPPVNGNCCMNGVQRGCRGRMSPYTRVFVEHDVCSVDRRNFSRLAAAVGAITIVEGICRRRAVYSPVRLSVCLSRRRRLTTPHCSDCETVWCRQPELKRDVWICHLVFNSAAGTLEFDKKKINKPRPRTRVKCVPTHTVIKADNINI